MTSRNSTRLFIENSDATPDNQVLVFSNATAVGNYYGSSSDEYKMALTYFTGPYASSATMEFVRDSNGQRPHLIGANLANTHWANVNGPISLTFGFGGSNFTYSGTVDTAGTANLTDVARDLQKALNSNLQTIAVTQGDSITPETVQFTGTLNRAQLYVTSVQSGGHVVVGGVISGPGVINGPAHQAQIIADRGSTKQGEHYSTFSLSGTASGALTETYGILHIGHVVSGQIEAGDHLSDPGVMANTAIVQDLGGGNWLVNNAQAISGDFTVTAPALTVQSNELQGPTAKHYFLEVSVGGEYGFNQSPSSLSFASGSAADLLGLSQSSGAMDSSPGGQRTSILQMMDQFIALAPDPFGSFQSTEPRLDGAFEHWQQHHRSYTFFSNNHTTTTPAGDLTTFIWTGGSQNWDTASAWTPPGPPRASSLAAILGSTTETIVVESANTLTSVILDNPNASLLIGGVAGAQLTVTNTLSIEEGTLGIGAIGTLDAAHIRIAAPKGSQTPTTGVLYFLGSATIGATVLNNGAIEAEGAAGSTVEFEQDVIGKGRGSADISNGGTLEFAKKVVQNIDFGAGGGMLSLLDPTDFDAGGSGSIAGFAAGDTISLAGDWTFHTLTNPTSGTTHLTVTSGAKTDILDFIGAYTQSDFQIASGATTTIKFA
jgi:hypothetical protein